MLRFIGETKVLQTVQADLINMREVHRILHDKSSYIQNEIVRITGGW